MLSKKGRKGKKQQSKRKTATVSKNGTKAEPGKFSSYLWKNTPPLTNESIYKKIFFALAIAFAVFMLLTAPQVGLNADDDIQNPYSDKLVDYYFSMGKNKDIYNIKNAGVKGQTIKYYGAIYELPAGILNRLLGFESNEPVYHQVRHIINAMFGIVALIFASLIAKNIGGWRAAMFSILLLGLSPRFFGHAMMNPKDIPFACGYLVSLFFMIKMLSELPRPSLKTVLFLSLGLAISIASRVGGVLLVAYLGLFLSVHFLVENGLKSLSDFRLIGRYLLFFLVPSFVGIAGGLIFWPYGLENPIEHIPETLDMFTKFSIGVKLLFGGDMVWSTEIPRSYIPTWLFISTPTVVLAGLLLFILDLKNLVKTYSLFAVGILLFAFIFPISYAIYKHSSLYGGMRHFLFAYSCAVILASIAWDFILRRTQRSKKINLFVFGLFVVLLLEPALFIAQNKNLAYLYFNLPSGGIKKAFGNYDLDHQGISTKQAFNWLENQGIVAEGMEDTITIASNFTYGISSIVKPELKGKVKLKYVRYRERFSSNWDYGVFLCHFMDGAYLRTGSFPTSRAIHTVTVDNIPVAVILEKKEDWPFLGMKAAKNNDWEKVVLSMEKEVVNHPDNEIAWQELSTAYLNLNNLPQAKDAADKCLVISPENLTANNNLGLVYLRQNKVREAIEAFEYCIELNNQNTLALYYLAIIYKNQNNLNLAVDYAKKAVESNPRFKGAYQLTADIYTQMGNPSMAEAYLNAMNNSN